MSSLLSTLMRSSGESSNRLLPRRQVSQVRANGPHRPEDYEHGFLKTILDRSDERVEESRITSDPEYTHLSALLDVCPRQYALAMKYDVTMNKSVTGAHRLVWGIGRAVEQHIRNTFIAMIDGAGVIGEWSCTCGKMHERGYRPSPAQVCAWCDTPMHKYDEFTMTDEEVKVIGNPDLLYRYDDKVMVYEIKSMTGEDWKGLKGPLGDHLFQASGYWKLLKQNGIPVHDKVGVIYGSKHFYYGSPYKEYIRDIEPAMERRLDIAWEKADEIRQAREDIRAAREMQDVTSVPLPAKHGQCTGPTSTRSKNCALCVYCHS